MTFLEREVQTRIESGKCKGVRLVNGKFVVRLWNKHQSTYINIGRYLTFESAVRARVKEEFNIGKIKHPAVEKPLKTTRNSHLFICDIYHTSRYLKKPGSEVLRRKAAIRAMKRFKAGMTINQAAHSEMINPYFLIEFIQFRHCKRKLIKAYREGKFSRDYSKSGFIYSPDVDTENEIKWRKLQIMREMG
mgnify:CR=1 FL=1